MLEDGPPWPCISTAQTKLSPACSCSPQAGPAMPPGLQLSVDPKQQIPVELGMPPGSREGSAAPNGEPAKKKRKKKAGARAKEEAKAAMAHNLQRHLARVNGSADAGAASVHPAQAAALIPEQQHANFVLWLSLPIDIRP